MTSTESIGPPQDQAQVCYLPPFRQVDRLLEVVLELVVLGGESQGLLRGPAWADGLPASPWRHRPGRV